MTPVGSRTIAPAFAALDAASARREDEDRHDNHLDDDLGDGDVGGAQQQEDDREAEAHDPDENEFGLERLKQVVLDNRLEPARKIVEAVFAAVSEFAPDDPLRDDQTVVVAKRLADPDVT